MDLPFTPVEIILIIGGLSVASIIAGIVAGLLGVGGGIVIVPVLYWVFTFTDFPEELAMHMAVATSLATIITTSVASMRAHHKRGAVDFDLLRKWAPALAVGALAGGLAARYFDAAVLTGIFGVVGILVAINLAVPRNLVLGGQLPGTPIQVALATVIGFVSSLMGIGGGTLGVPTLAAFSYPIHRAVGTASAFGIVIAIPAVRASSSRAGMHRAGHRYRLAMSASSPPPSSCLSPPISRRSERGWRMRSSRSGSSAPFRSSSPLRRSRCCIRA